MFSRYSLHAIASFSSSFITAPVSPAAISGSFTVPSPKDPASAGFTFCFASNVCPLRSSLNTVTTFRTASSTGIFDVSA